MKLKKVASIFLLGSFLLGMVGCASSNLWGEIPQEKLENYGILVGNFRMVDVGLKEGKLCGEDVSDYNRSITLDQMKLGLFPTMLQFIDSYREDGYFAQALPPGEYKVNAMGASCLSSKITVSPIPFIITIKKGEITYIGDILYQVKGEETEKKAAFAKTEWSYYVRAVILDKSDDMKLYLKEMGIKENVVFNKNLPLAKIYAWSPIKGCY